MSKYTIESIKSGNMQFNATSAKDFRVTMAKWNDATFELAEKIMAKSDRVKALRTLISTNDTDLERLAKGEKGVLRDEATIKAESVEIQAKIKAENDALAEYKKAQADRLKSAHDLLTKELYEAYKAYISNDKRDAYVVALAEWLDAQGLEPAMATLDKFVAVVGKKKNTARNKIKTGEHNGAFGFNQWRDIFLGEICDVMGDAIPKYKFTYVLKDERKKTK